MAPEDRLAAILRVLDAAVSDLARYATDVPFDRLARDGDASRMVRQALQEAIQACIDAGEIILARVGAPPARDVPSRVFRPAGSRGAAA